MTKGKEAKMKAKKVGLGMLLAPMVLLAGPAAKVDPVAEGYPDWRGVSAKNHIIGREICPSDLRHKATVVVEVEPGEKLQSQLLQAAAFIPATGLSNLTGNWEDLEIPRNAIVLISISGPKSQEAVQAIFDKKQPQDIAQKISSLKGMGCSIYRDVTFAGAPETEGKRPYVYVMGPEGKEPLAQGALNDATVKAVSAAVAKAKKGLDSAENKWRTFFGNLPEGKANPKLVKAMEKGKTAKKSPLDPVAKDILKGVLSKDAETAKEAQIQYDAILQAKSDLILRIQLESREAPHRAHYDIQELLKYWPMEKKSVEAALAKLTGNADFATMGEMFRKLIEWGDSNFNCKASEAKKIKATLGKFKKKLAPMKESKEHVVQNCAALMDMRVDDLLSKFDALSSAK